MSKTTTQERLEALGELVDACGKVCVVLPAEINLDKLEVAVKDLVLLVVLSGMTSKTQPPPAVAPIQTKPSETAPRKKPGRKPKTAQVEKAVKTAAPADPEAAPKKMMGVCVDCGTSYLKTSNVQRRCPGCGAARKAAAVASVSAGADRLARIKALDKKLDTIPE